MYDERTARIVCQDMASIMQDSINTIIEVVLAQGRYDDNIIRVLKEYIQKRNIWLS